MIDGLEKLVQLEGVQAAAGVEVKDPVFEG
jgi:hypothetical protein